MTEPPYSKPNPPLAQESDEMASRVRSQPSSLQETPFSSPPGSQASLNVPHEEVRPVLPYPETSDQPAPRTEQIGMYSESLLESLAHLPAADTNEFFTKTRELAGRFKDEWLALPAIVRDTALDLCVRLHALYILLLRLRRQRDYREFRQWIDQTRREFSHFPIFNTMVATYERSLGEDPRSMDRAIRASRRATEAFPRSPGVLHQFAEFVAVKAELHQEVLRNDLQDAEKAVLQAIALSPETQQPHFWATLARLQAQGGDIAGARKSIAEAIELEPSTGPDYSIRLTDYQLIEMRISFIEERALADRRNREGREELLSIRSQVLEVLGLMAAIIAFISTTVGIASKEFKESSRLLLVSGCVITAVFSVFAYVFRVAPMRRIALPLVIAILLLSGALWYNPLGKWWFK